MFKIALSNWFQKNGFLLLFLVLFFVAAGVWVYFNPAPVTATEKELIKQNEAIEKQLQQLEEDLKQSRKEYEKSRKELFDFNEQTKLRYENIIEKYARDNKRLKEKINTVRNTNYSRAKLDSIAEYAKFQ